MEQVVKETILNLALVMSLTINEVPSRTMIRCNLNKLSSNLSIIKPYL